MWIYIVEKQEDMEALRWENMKKGDIIQITDIEKVAAGTKQVKELFKRMIRQEIGLQIAGTRNVMNPEHILSLLEGYENIKNGELRRNQHEGIRKALEKRRQGEGTYGRPHVQLPDDFEKRVLDSVKQGCPLADYRKESAMAASTFYKYANRIISKYKLKDKSTDKRKQ